MAHHSKYRVFVIVFFISLPLRSNIVDECNTLEDAKKKYPKAKVIDLGEEWFDRLSASQNTPSNME